MIDYRGIKVISIIPRVVKYEQYYSGIGMIIGSQASYGIQINEDTCFIR